MNELKIMNIEGIDCYEKDGTAYLKLETAARGLGFTTVATSGNECVRWSRVDKYLSELGVPTCEHNGFIPENIFYRLAMKAKSPAAEAFQAKIADEVIPAIRKHGLYATETTVESILNNPDTFIELLQAFKNEKEKRKALEIENERQRTKAEYFDALVDRNTLTNFRVTAKEFHMGQKEFIKFLINRKFIYRDKKGRLLPYEPINGLFEVKECKGPNNKWSGIQTLVTPKGRETFRLMLSHR